MQLHKLARTLEGMPNMENPRHYDYGPTDAVAVTWRGDSWVKTDSELDDLLDGFEIVDVKTERADGVRLWLVES
jgi:hypothetical protein